MNRTTSNLQSTLVPQAARLPGQELAGVLYWALQGEATKESISDAGFYFGGEIELMLVDQPSMFVSWLEGAGWSPDSYFTLYLGESSAFLRDASLERFDASTTTFWSNHIGRRIDSSAIIGVNGAPSVLRLTTQHGIAYCGASSMTEFGDGDDVMAADNLTGIRANETINIMWQSPCGDAT
jgi:hypothetical protein